SFGFLDIGQSFSGLSRPFTHFKNAVFFAAVSDIQTRTIRFRRGDSSALQRVHILMSELQTHPLSKTTDSDPVKQCCDSNKGRWKDASKPPANGEMERPQASQ